MDSKEIIELFKTEMLGIPLWKYLACLGAVIVGFILKKITGLIFRRLIRAASKSRLVFDDILLTALSKPFEWAVLLAGVFVGLLIMPLPKEPVDIYRFVVAVITAVSVGLVVWVATRAADGVSDWWAQRAAKTESKLDDQLVPIVRRSLKVFFYLIGLVLVLQNLGYSVGSLLAGLGIGGVAIALASKDAIANLFGSLVIFLDKPFQIGDWIEMGSLEGTVEEVGLRTTRVRTFANSLVTVPNAKFTTESVNNWSRMKKRRIKMTIGLTYSASPSQVEQAVVRVRQIIADDPKIRNDFYLVNFDNLGPSSLDLFVYCFTETTNWAEFLQAKQEFLLAIMRAVEKMGLELAYPTQTLHIEKLPEDPSVLTRQRPL
jgi:MscS family membrane protein